MTNKNTRVVDVVSVANSDPSPIVIVDSVSNDEKKTTQTQNKCSIAANVKIGHTNVASWLHFQINCFPFKALWSIVWPNICVWFFLVLLLLLLSQLIYSCDLFIPNGLLNHVMVCRSLSKTIITYCCRRRRRSSFSLSQSKLTNRLGQHVCACVCVRSREHSIAIFSLAFGGDFFRVFTILFRINN